MNENDISYLIFLIFACCGSYIAGKQIGIRGTIDYLEEKGILTFDDNETMRLTNFISKYQTTTQPKSVGIKSYGKKFFFDTQEI